MFVLDRQVQWTSVLALGASAIAAAVAMHLAATVKTKTNRKIHKGQLQWAMQWSRWTGKSLWLLNVRVPVANLSSTDHVDDHADHEGLVTCHMQLQADGTIAQVMVHEKDKDIIRTHTKNDIVIDGASSIVLPCFADAHTHMVKTQTVPRNINKTGTMTEALEVEMHDQTTWTTPSDRMLRLMDFAVRCAYHHGTKAMRTHLDGIFSEPPVDPALIQAVYHAFDTIRDKYREAPYYMTIQGVANLFLPLWMQEPYATEHANLASQHQQVVLGAYVPTICTPQEHNEAVQALDALFHHAHRLDMDVDLHIDESNHPQCRGLLALIESLGKARRTLHYQGRVVLGHCCALSLQEKELQKTICRDLARLDNVHVVANPFTNLGLQDRSGSTPPFSMDISLDEPRTPQWRGLTAFQELRAAGVVVAGASDNVRDHWYPYGDYDMLTVWAAAQAMGHLDTAPSAGHWANICTDAPAEAMGILTTCSRGLTPGNWTDIILFPSARNISELFARPQVDRIVIRHGRIQADTTLPDFAELDDLM